MGGQALEGRQIHFAEVVCIWCGKPLAEDILHQHEVLFYRTRGKLRPLRNGIVEWLRYGRSEKVLRHPSAHDGPEMQRAVDHAPCGQT